MHARDFSANREDWEATSQLVRRRTSFTWKIQNFSLCPVEGFYRIQSPSFNCSSSKWAIELFPNGHDEQSEGYIGISLTKLFPDTGILANCKFCVKDKYGTDHYLVKETDVFGVLQYFWGFEKYVKREILLTEKRSELLHDDVLTLYCELTLVETVVQQELENVYLQNTSKNQSPAACAIPRPADILLKDLEGLLRDQTDCDVTLQVGDYKFRAHKLMLKARSSVFATLFEQGTTESPFNIVTINDIEPAVMNDLLHYVYTGTVSEMSVEKAVSLYVAADKYALSDLKSQCADFIQKNLSVKNACDVAVLADMHNDGKIVDTIKLFVIKNTSLLSTEKWKRLAEDNPRLAYEIILAFTLPVLPASSKL